MRNISVIVGIIGLMLLSITGWLWAGSYAVVADDAVLQWLTDRDNAATKRTLTRSQYLQEKLDAWMSGHAGDKQKADEANMADLARACVAGGKTWRVGPLTPNGVCE